jgi:predicted dehydrogenase
MEDDMIGLGIIGAGIMGERMAKAAQEHAGAFVRLTGVWDPQDAAMARITKAVPGLHAARSAAELIAASDCVYVASPPASHLVHGSAALDAGKALFCEKPLSANLTESRDFLARHAGARAAVNFPFASSFAVAQIATWLPALGPLQSLTIDVAFRLWPRPWQQDAASWLDRRPEGGFTREVMSHFLFLTRRLLGPLTLDQALVQFPQEEQSERDIRAVLTAGGIPVNLTGNVGTTTKDDHNVWTLRGANGAIRLRDWSFAEQQGPDGSWHGEADAISHERLRPLVLRRQLEGVKAMTEGLPHPLATPQEAFEVQMIVEHILMA